MKLRTTNDLSQLRELLDTAEKTGNQPQEEKPKSNPVKQKVNRSAGKAQPINQDMPLHQNNEPKEKSVESKNNSGKTNEDAIMQAVDDFIYGKTPRYSGKIKVFAKEKENGLRVLEHLKREFDKSKEGEGKVKRGDLLKLAVEISAENIEDKSVEDALTALLKEMSKVAQGDYIRYSKKDADTKDAFFLYMSRIRNEKMTDFLHVILQGHAEGLYLKLKGDAQKKYKAWVDKFSRETEEKISAENEAKLKKEAEKKAKAEEAKPKDKKSTETKTGSKEMTEEELTGEQKAKLEALAAKGISTAAIKTQDDYKKKIGDLEKEAEKLAIAPVDARGDDKEKPTEKEAESAKKDVKVEEKSGEGDGITVKGEGEKTPTPFDEDRTWIEEKKAEYQKRFENKEITGYKWDDTITNGFAAHVEGGYIHYTSKNNVTVSKESGLRVFEVLVTEAHNAGKPVHFGDNLEHKQAVKLLAACLIHGNPIGNNPPALSKEDLLLLKTELEGRTLKDKDGKDIPLFEALQDALAPYIAKGEGDKKKEGDDKSAEAKPKVKAFDEKTKEELTAALNRQYEMAALESTGLVNKLPDGTPIKNPEKKEDGSDKYSTDDFNKYMELKNKQNDDKDLLAKKFIENEEGVRAIIKELLDKKTNKKLKDRNEAERADLAAARKAQIEALKARKSMLHGTEKGTEKESIDERRKQIQEEMSVALGIKEPSEEQKKAGMKALSIEELPDYVEKNNISKFTYDNLLKKYNDSLKEGETKKEKDDKVRKACKDSSNIYLAEKGGREA